MSNESITVSEDINNENIIFSEETKIKTDKNLKN